MTTKRTPINRPPRDRFTPEALVAFRKMHELEERCSRPEERDWDDHKHKQCSACAARWEQHWILHQALRLRPWQYHGVERPDAESPYPTGCEADKNWRPDQEAQARYRALAATSE